jgi:hypothetical protein
MLLAGPVLAAGSAPDAPRLQETYGRLPLHFIENRGQMDARVKVYAQGQGYALFFTAEGIILAGRIPAETGGSPKAALVKITPRGSSLNAPQPEEPLPGKVNYLVGNDPHKWRTRVPTYAAVRYREVFPGIDLKCYGAGSRLEYDLIVRPGADPSGVKFQVEGAAALKITPEGDLAMSLPGGPVVIQKKPVIYQEIHGRQVAREGGFKISRRDRSCYGFELAAYDPARPLIIDPAIRYSTFLGGGQDDQGAAIAVDATGNAYITGQTFSLAFPVTRSRPFIIFPEAFVTKINAAGNGLVFSTFLGGNGNEAGTGIAVDGTGVYVTGWTDSLDFPVRNAFQPTKDLAVDAFVAKLNPSGSALIYSSYLGGNGDDRTAGLALIAGQAIVTGTTSSIDFPVRAALQPINLGNTAAFVTRLTAAGSGLVFSTYLGGSKEDIGTAVAVDGGGNTYVTGGTTSLNFPILNPFQGNNLGSQDAFVSKLSPTGRLLYSTFLGGSSMDVARAIAVDGLGQAYVTGETASQNFPLRNPFQGARWGTRDAFVTRLTAAGNNLSYSTYLGGSNTDQGLGIRVDGAGQATVVGVTASFDFPVRNAVQPAYRGGASDAFVTRFTPTGRALVYSTFLGGQKIEQAKAVALLAPLLTTAFVTGFTNSFNFPIRSAFQPSLRGANDVFVTRINP